MVYIHTTDNPKEALQIQKAPDMAICLWEINSTLRRRYLKYKDDLTDEEYSMAEDIFSDINHELDRWGINLDDLMD